MECKISLYQVRNHLLFKGSEPFSVPKNHGALRKGVIVRKKVHTNTQEYSHSPASKLLRPATALMMLRRGALNANISSRNPRRLSYHPAGFPSTLLVPTRPVGHTHGGHQKHFCRGEAASLRRFDHGQN